LNATTDHRPIDKGRSVADSAGPFDNRPQPITSLSSSIPSRRAMHSEYVERLVNLMQPERNALLGMTQAEAEERVRSGDPARVREIDGHFAIVTKDGKKVRMARSLGRPMRYFLAKRSEGPCLVVAERIDEIHRFLRSEGLDGQFHPSYTRMVPAHHLLELQLIGCPDPNPGLTRFFVPERNRLSSDLDDIGRRYIGALATEIDRWLNRIEPQTPIGVLFSGGIDSGAVFLATYHALLQRGESPARLKCFTLTVEGGPDGDQARTFLKELGLDLFLETVAVPPTALDFREAIRVIEDYKPLDVQAATMGLALCREVRRRYPEWRYLVDGDGGDENLKDYPIEENPELTIRSVLNNPLLYHEGWGVGAVKHSLTYSGGQSRGHVRSSAPPAAFGFEGFSPFALPNVIEVAEGIPFIELTDWSHEKLYSLKGEIVRRGVRAVTGHEMPVYEKRRIQRGAVTDELFERLFPRDELTYRRAFAALYE
jgi:asparagine synthase (glutamine-hydrolysing)